MTSPRTGLLLDFGGVLTTPLLPAVLAFERREGLAEMAAARALFGDAETVRRTQDLERGTLTQAEWNAGAAPLLGVPDENLMGRLFADLRPEPSVIAAAAAARRAGVKVGVLSNSVGADPFDLYAGYDLEGSYDAVVISERHGLRKPEPEIFRLALSMLELPAEACVFVDDTPEYVAAAEELGFAAVVAKDPAGTVARLEALLGVPLAQAA